MGFYKLTNGGNPSLEKAKTGAEIWVLGEVQDGALLPVSLELMGEGLTLSIKLDAGLCGVLIGDEGLELYAESMASYGAQKVYLIRNAQLANYNCELYTQALYALFEQCKPSIIIAPATPNCNDFIPRVAARAKAVLVPNCNVLNVDGEGALLCTRPVYGGKFSATVKVAADATKIVTIRPGTIELEKPDPSRKAETIEVTTEIEPGARATRVGFIKGNPQTVDLTEAERIVAGGRGAKSRDGWKLIEALAEALEGSVGGSRVAVDEGWIGFARGVGQTGKTVKPKLYIACGISGSIYHTAGIRDSKLIIAINIDHQAEIFKVADVGVRGDLHEVIPALLQRIGSVVASQEGT